MLIRRCHLIAVDIVNGSSLARLDQFMGMASRLIGQEQCSGRSQSVSLFDRPAPPQRARTFRPSSGQSISRLGVAWCPV
jgi:hypothetical protein